MELMLIFWLTVSFAGAPKLMWDGSELKYFILSLNTEEKGASSKPKVRLLSQNAVRILCFFFFLPISKSVVCPMEYVYIVCRCTLKLWMSHHLCVECSIFFPLFIPKGVKPFRAFECLVWSHLVLWCICEQMPVFFHLREPFVGFLVFFKYV